MSGRDRSWDPVLCCPSRPRRVLRDWAAVVLAADVALTLAVLVAWDGPRWRGVVAVVLAAAGAAVVDRMMGHHPCPHEACACGMCLEHFELDRDADPDEVLGRLWATLERRARRRGDVVVVGLTVGSAMPDVSPEWWAASVVADLQARCGTYAPNGSCVLPVTRQWAAGLAPQDVTTVESIDPNTLELARRLCRTLSGGRALSSALVSCT